MSGLLATHTRPIGYTWHCHSMCGHTCKHKGTTVSLWKPEKKGDAACLHKCDMVVCLFGLTSSHCSYTQQLYRSVSCQAKGPELSHGDRNTVVCPDRVQWLGNMDPCMIALINPKSNLHLTHLSVVCVCVRVCVCVYPRKHWPYRGSRCGATSSR